MALASVDDVRTTLRIPSTSVDDERDNQLQAALDAADAWVRARLRQDWDTNTGGTFTAYDIRETDSILLPQEGCTVTEVRAQVIMNAALITTDLVALESTQYDIENGEYGARVLRLRPILDWAPFEGAVASRMPNTYRKVEIDWEPSTNSVPAAITRATALIAAGMWKSHPRLASGFTSEKVGDYSYLVQPPSGDKGGGASSDFWQEANRMLRPFVRRKPLVT